MNFDFPDELKQLRDEARTSPETSTTEDRLVEGSDALYRFFAALL